MLITIELMMPKQSPQLLQLLNTTEPMMYKQSPQLRRHLSQPQNILSQPALGGPVGPTRPATHRIPPLTTT
jgi:hypothetical protein